MTASTAPALAVALDLMLRAHKPITADQHIAATQAQRALLEYELRTYRSGGPQGQAPLPLLWRSLAPFASGPAGNTTILSLLAQHIKQHWLGRGAHELLDYLREQTELARSHGEQTSPHAHQQHH